MSRLHGDALGQPGWRSNNVVLPARGAWAPFAPVVTQLGVVTCTVNNSSVMRVGRMINWRWTLTVTGSGTAANLVTLSLPANIAYVSDFAELGGGRIYDISATTQYMGFITPASASTIKVATLSSSNISIAPAFLGVSNFTAGLAVNDVLSGYCTYEAATDV